MRPNLLKKIFHSKSLIFILCLGFSQHVFAQAPSNDSCGGASLLVSGISCTATAGTLINATKTLSPPGTCGTATSPDVWYWFVAKSAFPTITLNPVGKNLNTAGPVIQLLGGACGAQTELACVSGNNLNVNTSYPQGLIIGTTYFIRITTNSVSPSFSSGTYTFSICVTDLQIDFSKAYINLTDGNVGGTINPGDSLEIRATFVVTGNGVVDNLSYYDTLKANAGFRYRNSTLATRTNEGKVYNSFTDLVDADAAGYSNAGLGFDTTIRINIGTGATASSGGTLLNTSRPSFYNSTCIIMATYRVTVTAAYDTKINFGGGAFKFTVLGVPYTINFRKDSLKVYQNLTACSDAVSPGNLIGSANNGTFGGLSLGSTPTSASQNGGAATINTTYGYQTFSGSTPTDYYYGIANNTSPTNVTTQTLGKPGGGDRVFGLWDITGDHTGAVDQNKGNKPCDVSKPVSATNPCGYMLAINSSYRTDKVFEYTATGVCSETYYEVSAWFKNLCYKCGCDSTGNGASSGGYIPTASGDSSGVRPNIAMQIDGIDYYTTGDILYQGLGGTQTGSDTLNNWVRRSFVFKTSVAQTSFKVTFRNNAPGGGGNDWAVDDIGLRTCYPIMIYAPPNPIVYIGSALTITDTVRSYFNSYTYYKWQTKPVAGSWTDVSPASFGNAVPVYNPLYNQFEYNISYTIPGTATLAANAGDAYRMIVASNALNLANGCNFIPSTTFTLLPTDAPCAKNDTNYAIAPQTESINWNKLNWSLGHVPTCCESAQITYNSSNPSKDSITVNITNDICIINLTLINKSSSANQLFKTILYPGYNMQMNGHVRMGAPAGTSTDSCIFIARGGGTITVNGNTVIGYPADNAYCIFGSSPDIALNHTYVLKGDSLTFNNNSFTNDKLITVIMNPIKDTAYLVNNTNVVPYPNAVTFENFKIGNASKLTTVIAGGSNQNSFMNNRGGALEVTSNARLVLPANNTINARSPYNSNLQLRANSILRIGGYSGGTTGSNFPANFTLYNADATSLTEYYGDNSNAQTVYGITYGKLELRNGTTALGIGRAQKNSILPISSLTSINVNQQTDFTLGTLGSSSQTVASAGLFNLTAGSGLYCNANVISGAGIFTMGNGSYLGMGHIQGISNLGSATGNIQLTGGRNYNTTGNYIYNGIVPQITGAGIPTIVNDLTTDNPTTVTIATNQLVNGVDSLKQGTFDIGFFKITHNGTGTLNSIGGKMKANVGIVEMKGTSGTAQNLKGNWFLNKTISTLINANTKGITVAAAPADTLLIASALVYGAVSNSAITTNDNLTLLSRDTATAGFGTMISGNSITGKVMIERYLPAKKSWRLLAAPIGNATSPTVTAAWREGGASLAGNGYGTRITGPAGFTGVDENTQRASMKYYDPATNNYINVSNTNTSLISNTQGYYVFVRGDRGVPIAGTAAPTILRIKGDVVTGTQVVNVPAGKFVTFGNPYPSNLNLKTVAKANISNTYYAWNPNSAGSYNVGAFENYTFDGTNYLQVPGGAIRNTIQSGEAIFIQSSGGAGTFTINETDKIGGSTLPFSRTAPTQGRTGVTKPTLEINMYTKDIDSSTYLADGILMNFNDDYSSAVDNDDVRKILNAGDNIFLKNGNSNLIVERRPTLKISDTIKLNLTNTRINPYRFEFDPSALSNVNLEGTLIDKFVGSETAVSLLQVTNYNFNITADASSKRADRFMIVFKQVPPMRFITITAVREKNSTATVTWYTENENNVNYYIIESSKDGVNFTEIGKQMPTANNNGNPYYSYIHTTPIDGNNWYRVKAEAITGASKYSEIAKTDVKEKEVPTAITLFPNPIIDGKVHVSFTSVPAGKYQLSVNNMEGQSIYNETLQIQTNNLKKTIRLSNVAAGNYLLIIKDEKGISKKISFIVK